MNAPTGIRTRVFGSKGRNDWPDYTIGAYKRKTLINSYLKKSKNIIFTFFKMGPGPRIEPESRDPQSRRITTILPRH